MSLLGGTATTKAGKNITPHSSLKISAFWCGVNTIANSIAMLPKHIYNKSNNSRKALQDHPVDFLIHREPNSCMTAYNFWFSIAVCAKVRGKGFAKIIRNGAGAATQLELLHPDEVTVLKKDGQLWYRIAGEKKLFFSDEIFHITDFSWDGITGVGVIQYAADSMSISLAADTYGAEAFSDRGVSYGVLETDKDLGEKGEESIRKLFSTRMNSNDKHKLAVFDEGMKYKRIALSPAEAQFIETKATGVEDIARWLNIPLHKLHAKGEGGYNFLVQMSIEYISSAVMPLAQRIKEETERKLLTPEAKAKGDFVFINYRKLLEADPKSRGEYYKMMYMVGAYNADEIREKEDESPREDGKGNEYFHMGNMMSNAQLQKDLENAE